MRHAEFTPPEYLHADQTALTEILTTGSCKPFEKAYLRKDGGVVPVLMGAALIERHPPEWVGFVVDLTERKALERKLQAKQKLESIGLLAGGVAHDFNNLLVGILGNASLAQEFAAPGSALAQMWTTSWGRASAPPT